MNFKSNKWKVVAGVLAIVLWILFSRYFNSLVRCECVSVSYYDQYYLVGIGCDCYRTSFFEMVCSNILNILIPFFILYVIWSLFEKKKKSGRRQDV